METLVFLAQNAPEPVTREEFFTEVWQGSYVSEGVLNRVISALRKAFGDDPQSPQYIATLPRVGYRLLQPVEWEGGVPPVRRPSMDVGKAGRRWQWIAGVAGACAIAAASFAFFPTVPEGGVTRRPLTSDPGLEFMPALAPDGEWLAWVGVDQVRAGVYWNWGIYVATRDSATPPRLFVSSDNTSTFFYSPTWSPDSSELAWHEVGPNDECAVVVRALVAESPRRRFACRGVSGLDWSPDGRHLLISQASPGEPAAPVIELDIATGTTGVAVPSVEPYRDLAAQYSPNADRIATLRAHLGQTVFAAIFDRRGNLIDEFKPERGAVTSLDWLGSDELLLGLHDGSRQNLWRYRISSGRLDRIPDTEDVLGPTVAGDTIVYSQREARSRIWHLEGENPARPSVVEESTKVDFYPALSPTGKHLAFLSDRSGNMQVWINSDASAAVQATNLKANWVGPPRWHPDGARFLVEAEGQDGFATYVHDLHHQSTEPMELSIENYRDPVWTPDGRIAVTVEDDEGDWQLWTEGANGDWQKITNDGGLIAAFSPSGDAIYYTKFNRPGLWRKSWPITEQGEELVIPWLTYRNRRNWTPVKGGVVVPRTDASKVDLIMVAADGSETLVISAPGSGGDFIRGVSAFADGISYSAFETSAADLFEIEFKR